MSSEQSPQDLAREIMHKLDGLKASLEHYQEKVRKAIGETG